MTYDVNRPGVCRVVLSPDVYIITPDIMSTTLSANRSPVLVVVPLLVMLSILLIATAVPRTRYQVSLK